MGEVVGVPVASGLALGVDLEGIILGHAVREVVGVPVASGLALGVDVVEDVTGSACDPPNFYLR